MSAGMPVEILEWRPIVKNSLRGFCVVRLGKALKVKDIAISRNGNSCWASFPSMPVLDADKKQKKIGDKFVYIPFIEWMDRESKDKFSASVIEALEAAYPGATGG